MRDSVVGQIDVPGNETQIEVLRARDTFLSEKARADISMDWSPTLK